MDFYIFVRGLAKVITKLFYRVEVHGRENEPADGGFIAFSNHTSMIDVAFTAVAVRRPLYFMAKSELTGSRFLRWVFKVCHVVAINRGESDIAALKKTCALVSEGKCIGIYPQGTRIPTHAPTPESAQAGIGLMATRTKAPLLPVTICYGKGEKPRLFRKVHVYVEPAITYEEYSTLNERPNSHEIAEYAFSKLCESFGEHNNA